MLPWISLVLSSISSQYLQIYITQCSFQDCTSSSAGGAVYYSPGATAAIAVIESSTFLSCEVSDGSGGAICIYSASSLLSKLCGVNCSCSSNGAFAYTSVSSGTVNDCRDSSIVACQKNKYFTIFIGY